MANETDASPPAGPPEYTIHEASLGPHGAVVKGKEISQADAEVMRKAGQDVVVCGPELATNRRVAAGIEGNANGAYKLSSASGRRSARTAPLPARSAAPSRTHLL